VVKLGDLVLVPHGGERFGKVLGRVERASASWSGQVMVRVWSPSLRRFDRTAIISDALIAPAPESDRRVKAVRRMDSKVPGKGGEDLRPCD
jgi:hypothetical protein